MQCSINPIFAKYRATTHNRKWHEAISNYSITIKTVSDLSKPILLRKYSSYCRLQKVNVGKNKYTLLAKNT